MNKFINLIINAFLIYDLETCQSTNGTQIVQEWEAPCLCNGQICQVNQFCNESKGICSSDPTNNLDLITVEGSFTFENAAITDHNPGKEQQTSKNRLVDNNFETIFQIQHSFMAVTDVGNGTQWNLNSKAQKCHQFKNAQGCQDINVELRRTLNGEVLKSHRVRDMSKHEIRPGNHELEVVMIKTQKYDKPNSRNMIYIQGLLILDFSFSPPKETFIDPSDDFDPDYDWGSQSNEKYEETGTLDWMHGNSAGVDLDGNQQMAGRNGSFWALWDKHTKKRMYTVAAEFRSDQSFTDITDKMYNQHDTYQLQNGNWLVLDNGLKRPQKEGGEQTRCIEQELDHVSKTVRKVWEFQPGYFCSYAGSCRRLENGNTLMLLSNCVPVDTPPLIDGPQGPDDLIENQVIEVDYNKNILGRATIPWGQHQIIQRAVPNFKLVKSSMISDIHYHTQFWVYLFGSIIFGVIIQLSVKQNQFIKQAYTNNENEDEDHNQFQNVDQINLDEND